MSGPRTRSQRVRLDSVRSLTFYDGEQTAARRSAPVEQLTCKGKACRSYRPDVIHCTSLSPSGTPAADIEWSCQADLPASLRLGRTAVSCEGYDGPHDDYVLKGAFDDEDALTRTGSCGLTYNLISLDPSLDQTSYPSAWRKPC